LQIIVSKYRIVLELDLKSNEFDGESINVCLRKSILSWFDSALKDVNYAIDKLVLRNVVVIVDDVIKRLMTETVFVLTYLIMVMEYSI